MKRTLSLVLAISMIMSMFTFSFAGTILTDVAGTDYQAAVEGLVELGIVNGYEDGTYRPEQNVSRAEMAKLLVVAAGLEPAAKLAEGATKFADVNGGWASGYVNIASEYGYVIGYPDGTFRPDDTVSYAEATTMALRVLGYKAVVESKGTWPTNYIAKAEDLELLEDISYNSYDDGAARGYVAILVWNMLKTEMWEIVGESEGDGLHYEADRVMLNVKFPDYSYSYAEFVDFEVNEDGKVEVTLNDKYGRYEGDLEQSTYVYEGIDFYKFVPGTEVEVLVNEEDEIVLTMVATGREKIVEGDKLAIDEAYDAISGDTYDYAYGIVTKKEISGDRQLKVLSSEMIVEKTEKNGKYVKLNKVKYENDEYDYEVIIKDGKRVTINDIEVGDVLSKVETDNKEVFYMVISRDTDTEGKLTKYVVKQHVGNKENYHILTVGGEEYLMYAKATYVEDPNDEKEKQNKTFATSKELEDMKGEVVTLIRDFLGNVVRVEFDGSIDEASKEVKFFVVTEEVEKEGIAKYVIGLENKDESDTYNFAKSCNLAKTLYNSDKEIIGTLVAVELNDEDEITNMMLIARAGISGDSFEGLIKTDVGNYISGDEFSIVYNKEEINGYYKVVTVSGDKAKYDDKNEKLAGINVDESVIVISLLADDNGTSKDYSDDSYSAIIETGLEAIENIKNEEVMIIVDAAETFKYAKIVVRFDDNSNREDDLVGVVEEARENKLGEYTITIDGETYTFRKEDNTELVSKINTLEGAVIVFSTKTDKKDEEYATVVSYLLENVAVDYKNAVDQVIETSASAIALSGDKTGLGDASGMENFKETFHDKYDEYLFVRLVVDSIEGEIDLVEEPIKGTDINASFFNEDDGIIYDTENKVVWVIEGLEWPEVAE